MAKRVTTRLSPDTTKSISDRPTPGPAPEPEPTRDSATERAGVERIAIPMVNGRPALDRMRDGTRDALRKMVSDPTLARELGITSPTDPAAVPTVPIELAHALLGSVNQITTLIVASMTKAPGSVLAQVMPYSAEETDIIAPPLQRVLSKYAGPALSKWSDELTLAAALLAVTQAKMMAVRQMMKATAGPCPVVVPIRPAEPTPGEPGSETP